MQWNSPAIVLHTAPYGERDLRVSVFTPEHGRYHAMVKGGAGKQHRATWQTGNLLQVQWNARLAEHMGTFRGELITPFGALLMGDALTLSALAAACGLLERSLLERDPHPTLYELLHDVLDACAQQSSINSWLAHYALFEYALLHESGFGLDVSCCAATGVVEELVYISPKSGRAVSRTAGAPYHDKMLPLTRLIAQGSTDGVDARDAQRSLEVTGYFLQHWLFANLHQTMPDSRTRLLEKLRLSS